MELKVLVLVCLSSLLIQAPWSQVAAKRQEIVRKKVTVNLPKRIIHPVSHFNPQTHEYAAEGNVVIDRETPDVKVPEPIKVKAPEPPKNLEKEVLVHSPATIYSQNRHFDPAPHNYKASGTVLINRNSPFLNTQRHIFQPLHGTSPSKDKGSGFTLTKVVSVKSPQTQTSSISHFNPAGHVYAATGDVVIDRNAPRISIDKPNNIKKNFYEQIKPINIVSTSHEKSTSVNVPTFLVRPKPTATAELAVKKSVSVQLPEHRISAINHFNPAGHKYVATGGVQIDRTSSIGALEGPRPISTIERVKTYVKTTDKKPEKVNDRTIIETVKTPARVSSGLGVKKKVTVHTPEHRVSLINHFNPAGHKYDAVGGVQINRDASLRPVKDKPTLRRPTGSVNIVKPVRKPITIVETRRKVIPSKVTVSRPTTTYKRPVVEDRRTGFQTVDTPTRVSSGLGVKKKVTVHTPEHRVSLINHFNPAGHKYDAVGGVQIDRDASLGPVKDQPTLRRPTGSVNIVKPVRKPITIVETRRKVIPPKVTVSRPITTYKKPVVEDRRTVVQTVDTPTRVSSGLGVKKKVTVHTPEHRVSLINHFNPAGHKYDAVGGVQIDRDASLGPVKDQPTLRRPTGSVNIVKPVRKPITIVETRRKVTPPKVTVSRPTTTYKRPVVEDRRTVVQTVDTPTRVSSGLGVKKKVTVHTPEHRVSLINHFNPAGHKYDAVGGVQIDRDASLGPVKDQPTLRRPTGSVNIVKPVRKPITIVETRRKVTPPKVTVSRPITTYKKPVLEDRRTVVQTVDTPTRVSSGLGVKKKVTVHTPEHRVSLINHFNPAGHKYDAEGGVQIDRDASLGPVKDQPTLRRPTGSVNIVKPVRKPITIVETRRKVIPPKVTVSRPITTYKKPVVEDRRTVVQTVGTPTRVSSGLGVQKKVTVHTPEHRVSLINHFNPAGHKYDAEGGVQIDRDASLGPVKDQPTLRRPTGSVNIVKPVRKPITIVETRRKVISPLVKVPRPTTKYVEADDKDDGRRFSKPYAITIGVLPETKTLSSDSGVQKKEQKAPADDDKYSKPVVSSIPQQGFFIPVPGQKSRDPPKPKDTLGQVISLNLPSEFEGIASYLPPPPDTRKPDTPKVIQKIVKPSPLPLPSPEPRPNGSISIKKKVTVHSPQQESHVISHFQPALPNYAATGEVSINRST